MDQNIKTLFYGKTIRLIGRGNTLFAIVLAIKAIIGHRFGLFCFYKFGLYVNKLDNLEDKNTLIIHKYNVSYYALYSIFLYAIEIKYNSKNNMDRVIEILLLQASTNMQYKHYIKSTNMQYKHYIK
jgi:hypothetical protein